MLQYSSGTTVNIFQLSFEPKPFYYKFKVISTCCKPAVLGQNCYKNGFEAIKVILLFKNSNCFRCVTCDLEWVKHDYSICQIYENSCKVTNLTQICLYCFSILIYSIDVINLQLNSRAIFQSLIFFLADTYDLPKFIAKSHNKKYHSCPNFCKLHSQFMQLHAAQVFNDLHFCFLLYIVNRNFYCNQMILKYVVVAGNTCARKFC